MLALGTETTGTAMTPISLFRLEVNERLAYCESPDF